jgi:hypothetical protein
MSSKINRTRSGTITLGTAGTVTTQAVDAEKDRQNLIIQSGTAGLYYGFSSASVAGGSALYLASGTTTYSLSGYTGPLFVKTATGAAPYVVGELVI